MKQRGKSDESTKVCDYRADPTNIELNKHASGEEEGGEKKGLTKKTGGMESGKWGREEEEKKNMKQQRKTGESKNKKQAATTSTSTQTVKECDYGRSNVRIDERVPKTISFQKIIPFKVRSKLPKQVSQIMLTKELRELIQGET